MGNPKIVAYVKTVCGWSNGVRAMFAKYNLPYEERDVIQNPKYYEEMVRKSGQPLSPCVEVNGEMLADVSGDEVEAYLVKKGYLRKSDEPAAVPTDSACEPTNHELTAG